MNHAPHSLAYRFFDAVVAYRWPVIVVCMLAIGAIGAFLPSLTKDTTPEAFVPANSPVLQYRDEVETIFGLKDPMVLAVINDGDQGVFNPQSLALIDWLTDAVKQVPGIDPDRVTSLATENNIVGTSDGMLIEPFWEDRLPDDRQSRAIWRSIQDFPLMLGTLVARDGSATMIVAEMLADDEATRIYFDLQDLAATAKREGLIGPDDVVHVAGQGAVSGYLASYIDADAMRLNPIAGVIITLVLILAYRTLAGALLPNLVVLGTAAVGLGSMAAAGVPMYVITGSLPAILIGIAVCDSIHVFSAYYEETARDPGISARRATVNAMVTMWRPITLTTVTTVAGFLGLASAAGLPPMQWYGVFAAAGIAAAWLWSLLLLPATLSLFKPRPSSAIRLADQPKPDAFTKGMRAVGHVVAKRPRAVLAASAALLVIAVVGASQVEFNDERIHAFNKSTPLRIADAAINERFDGTYYIDVSITTPDPEDLFLPDNLRRIERLQRWMEDEAGVINTTSIVDYIKEMNRSINEDDPAAYIIPDNADLIAQYFLLYSASGEPTDFQEEIDYDYRLAHVRGQLRDDNFQRLEPIVLALRDYLESDFNSEAITGEPTGAIPLTYSWLKPLGPNTAQGMGIALLLVFAAAALFFKSLVLGALATLPVLFAVLMVFAVMGYTGIWIGVGTSMFAAIAIGLGVDFAIHSLDRMRSLIRDEGVPFEQAVIELSSTTGRALFFNLLALSLGFGVLMTSAVPPLQNFGLLVAIAVVSSFVISLTAMPALIGVLRPKRLFADAGRATEHASTSPIKQAGRASLPALTVLALVAAATAALAQEPSDANAIMQAVDQRDEGITQRSKIRFELTDRRDKTRVQDAVALRRYFGDDKKQVFFYLEPSNIRDTGFLTFDYADPSAEDDQWLYLPALRKTRRISASDRGDYFLGTDLTYEDLKRQNKVSLEDWDFVIVGEETVDGTATVIIEGTPATPDIADELGYGKGRWWVDTSNHTLVKSQNWDTQGNLFKTAHFRDIRLVDDVWTVHDITVENHKTEHRTHLVISDVEYGVELDEQFFEERTLRRGYRG